MKKEIKRKGHDCLVEEKVYYRYVGEHSQSQTHLKVSRVLLTLSREGRGEGREENPVQQRGG